MRLELGEVVQQRCTLSAAAVAAVAAAAAAAAAAARRISTESHAVPGAMTLLVYGNTPICAEVFAPI